ncbi:FAD binding domain-containing protein [Chelativorans salis]|uniref:Xanthine dehydrogenase family protein subunit M n=1 Tax=Chelativorans salis TaxID=2978478 RepID=A0ABT2LRC7_9HYPH|nr:xanthine dehydrogenase family protein subunit M [Chelativorans sp. EGI FJ00035]MCT7376392.1 xanthine dehydrogenase family protein subunit M [Chelativorans sp. EGI FJ00035]
MAIRYAKPTDLEEALRLLGEARWTILAGGTDFYPALGSAPLRDDVLDINGLAALKGVSETENHIVIGARATWTELLRHPLPPAFDALKLAAREVGSIQIQNSGTVAGNLCNASPAADGVPPLLILDAEVEIRSAREKRILPLKDFILGNRKTALGPGEMVTAVRIPRQAASGTSGFVKLGARRYLVISIAMAAARVVVAEGKVAEAAISVGSCSAVAQRLVGLEERLKGEPPQACSGIVATYNFPELSPIDDVRGTASYRLQAAREIVARASLQATGGDAEGGLAA